MAHPEQMAFFQTITERFEHRIATAVNLLEVGSQNINGSVRSFFEYVPNYLGIDIGPGNDVDLVIPGELIELPDGWADLSISTECLEHASNWPDILLNMIRITKSGGVVLLTFAGVGRSTHGTLDSDCFSSPYTTSYYKNLGPDDLAKEVALGRYFSSHGFEVNSDSADTYFWGVRKGHWLSDSDAESDWESLEQRLARAQGQLGQAVSAYTQYKSQALAATSELAEAHEATRRARQVADQARAEAEKARQAADQARAVSERAREEVTEAHAEIKVAQEEAKVARIAVQKAEQERDTAMQNIIEITNSSIWRRTQHVRQFKDGVTSLLRRASALTPESSPLPAEGLILPERQEQKVLSEFQLARHHQDSTEGWIDNCLEQDWKHFRDLRRAAASDQFGSSYPNRVLVIDWKFPEFDKDSGSHRMDAILSIVCETDADLTFVSMQHKQDSCYRDRLDTRSILTIVGEDAAVAHLADAGHSYRKVLISRPETCEVLLGYVHLYCPTAKLIYDTVDLHYLRLRRGAKFLPDEARDEIDELLNQSEEYYRKELAIAEAVDTIIVVSEDERTQLLAESKNLDIVVIPNIHEVVPVDIGYQKRKDLLFVGGFDHRPNVDAVMFFCTSILPIVVEALGDIKFHIVGSNMPSIIRDLATANVNPIGYVQDLDSKLDSSRIFVAPLRYGAGMKGKVGQSMAHGLPVVGTSIAAEGIGVTHGKHLLIADDPEDFASEVIRLYGDQRLWEALSQQSANLIRELYSPRSIQPRVASLLGADQGEGG